MIAQTSLDASVICNPGYSVSVLESPMSLPAAKRVRAVCADNVNAVNNDREFEFN